MTDINLCNWEKYSCFGCCGYDFASKEKVENKLNKQTELWKLLGTKKFSERTIPYIEEEGICGHQVLIDNKVFCATHPLVEKNKGVDYREPRCKKEHICKTIESFKKWDLKKRENFLKFLRKKNLNWYDYSIAMNDGSLLLEFKSIEN